MIATRRPILVMPRLERGISPTEIAWLSQAITVGRLLA
jgi:hypothetical protein